MKEDDILLLEEYIDSLEKVSKKLEKNFEKKDQKEFQESKNSMLRIQRKIAGILT